MQYDYLQLIFLILFFRSITWFFWPLALISCVYCNRAWASSPDVALSTVVCLHYLNSRIKPWICCLWDRWWMPICDKLEKITQTSDIMSFNGGQSWYTGEKGLCWLPGWSTSEYLGRLIVVSFISRNCSLCILGCVFFIESFPIHSESLKYKPVLLSLLLYWI